VRHIWWRTRVPHVWCRAAAPIAVGVLLLSACGGSSGGGAGGVGPVTLTKVMSLDFEHTVEPLDAGAPISSAMANGPGGTVELAGTTPKPLRLVTGRADKGHGVAFPVPCPASTDPSCPKAIIEVADDKALDPGRDDYEWGASVLLEPDETSKGSNVMQKGFSVGGGSQWKLQVDGDNGHPSCVVVGEGESIIHDVYADITIADGKWHDVSCHRDETKLVITVDGAHRKSTPITKDLTISPAGPMRIGGKSLKPNNDQFFGTLDDVYVSTET
jgi:Concanavalin A-like lectin/glucanases superfamily